MVHQPGIDCQNISLTRMPLGKRLRLIVVWMFYCGIVGVFLWTLCLFIAIPAFLRFEPEAIAVSDAPVVFTQQTGLPWPATASKIAIGDNHGGFHGDGELYMTFEVDRTTLTTWLAGPAPWGQGTWKQEPIPPDIALRASFGTTRAQLVSTNGGPPEYRGNSQLISLFGSPDNRYAASERCCQSIPWHNGSLLVIDSKHNRVWLSVWDF